MLSNHGAICLWDSAPPTSYFLFGITKHLMEEARGVIVDFGSGLRRCSPSRQELEAFASSQLRRSGKYRKREEAENPKTRPQQPTSFNKAPPPEGSQPLKIAPPAGNQVFRQEPLGCSILWIYSCGHSYMLFCNLISFTQNSVQFRHIPVYVC